MSRKTLAHTDSNSVVVPLFNEAGTFDELHRRLTAVLLLIGLKRRSYVDDGSTDGTGTPLLQPPAAIRTCGSSLARNYGQTSALAAGFDKAAGDVIVAMDGDSQHAPGDSEATGATRRWLTSSAAGGSSVDNF